MKKVIIVDDQGSIRELLKKLLSGFRCQVVGEAANGCDALELITQVKPDIALLDINMPLKDGIETLKELQELEHRPEVIMLTSQNSIATVKECLKYGVKSFLLKSGDIEFIKKELKKHFE